MTARGESMSRFDRWMSALEARHLSDLTFPEVARALRALSSAYVERRSRLQHGAALDGAGKRAAFALFYGPLHYLLVHHIVASLGPPFTSVETLVDLGCGTGASGAGWAQACARTPRYVGMDRHPWAIAEARRTCADFGMAATLRVDDFTRAAPRLGRSARHQTGVLLAFAVNEIPAAADRAALLSDLIAHARDGACLLVVEPLARGVAPWWPEWQRAFEAAGGRAGEWRVAPTLPAIVEKLDRAAGLRHQQIRGRSLSLAI